MVQYQEISLLLVQHYFLKKENLYLYSLTSNSNCNLGISLYFIKSGNVIPTGKMTCVENSKKVSSASIDVVASQCQSLSWSSLIVYSSNSFIYATIACLDINSTQLIKRNEFIGVGNNPKVSLLQTDDNLVALEVHQDSYCWNNEEHNKTPYVKQCSQSPISTSYILTYSYGTLSSWKNLIEDPNASNLTSCSSQILHGMYDMGTNPSIDLFIDNSTEKKIISFVEIHRGISHNVLDTANCGLPRDHKGFVVDSWPLPKLG